MRLDGAGARHYRAIAELERNLTRAGLAGMRRAKLEGRHIGRRALELDEIAIQNQRAEGRSLRGTALDHHISTATILNVVFLLAVVAKLP